MPKTTEKPIEEDKSIEALVNKLITETEKHPSPQVLTEVLVEKVKSPDLSLKRRVLKRIEKENEDVENGIDSSKHEK